MNVGGIFNPKEDGVFVFQQYVDPSLPVEITDENGKRWMQHVSLRRNERGDRIALVSEAYANGDVTPREPSENPK